MIKKKLSTPEGPRDTAQAVYHWNRDQIRMDSFAFFFQLASEPHLKPPQIPHAELSSPQFRHEPRRTHHPAKTTAPFGCPRCLCPGTFPFICTEAVRGYLPAAPSERRADTGQEPWGTPYSKAQMPVINK